MLKRLLTGFEIKTVQDQGWSGITNGELVRLTEAQFDVLITSDQNLRYQQNLAKRRLAIIELPTNQVPLVIKLAPQVQATLENIKIGEFTALPLPK